MTEADVMQAARDAHQRITELSAMQARWTRVERLFDWAYAFAAAFVLAWWFDTAADRTAVRFLVAVLLLAAVRWIAVRLLAIPFVDAPMARFNKRWGKNH